MTPTDALVSALADVNTALGRALDQVGALENQLRQVHEELSIWKSLAERATSTAAEVLSALEREVAARQGGR